METRNGQKASFFKSTAQRTRSLGTTLLFLLVLLGTACTKGDETQCGTPENPCDDGITEEIVDY